MPYRYALPALIVLFAGSVNAMPRGSYLRRPAHSGASLLAQVQKDSSVRKRYAAYWKISEPAVLTRFQGLRLTRLPYEMESLVYYWRIEIGFHREVLKPGTLVFATPDGAPLLLQVCGNPIEPFPEPVPRKTPLDPETPLLENRRDPVSLVTLERNPEIALTTEPVPIPLQPGDPYLISLHAPALPHMPSRMPVHLNSGGGLPWASMGLLLNLRQSPKQQGIPLGNGTAVPPGIAPEPSAALLSLVGLSGFYLRRRIGGNPPFAK